MQYLRLKHPDKPEQVERFIRHIQSSKEPSRWRGLVDFTTITDEVLAPLDQEFEEALKSWA